MKVRTVAALPFILILALMQVGAAQAAPQLIPFSADMQFSSPHIPNSGEMSGKLYINQQHMRMDMQGGPGSGAVVITNFVTKTSDMLMPQQHMYMEVTAQQMERRGGPGIKPLTDPSNPCADEPDMTCKNLGVEQVNGRTCDHWQLTDKNGTVTNTWIDQKIHFPIKTVSPDATYVLTNIKEGEPAASLFEIPTGYQKMDLGNMMQGMRPPQQ